MEKEIEEAIEELRKYIDDSLNRLFLLSGFDELTEQKKEERIEWHIKALDNRINSWGKRTDHMYLVQDLFYIRRAGFSVSSERVETIVSIICSYVKIKTPEYTQEPDSRMRDIGIEELKRRINFIFLVLRYFAPEKERVFRGNLSKEMELVSSL